MEHLDIPEGRLQEIEGIWGVLDIDSCDGIWKWQFTVHTTWQTCLLHLTDAKLSTVDGRDRWIDSTVLLLLFFVWVWLFGAEMSTDDFYRYLFIHLIRVIRLKYIQTSSSK